VIRLTKTTTSMRSVRGARYQRFMGTMCCVEDDRVTDFNRTVWRLFGVPIWWKDTDHTDVPLHVFIQDCLGLR